MTGLDLKDLAKRGAIARLAELKAEAAAILKAFPTLRKGNLDGPFSRRGAIANTDDGTTILPNRRRRRRKPMSAAQRKAVGIRMKAYWAKRRRAQN
jgi:hypothetical protein